MLLIMCTNDAIIAQFQEILRSSRSFWWVVLVLVLKFMYLVCYK